MLEWTIISQIAWTSLANSSYFVLFAVAFALVLKVNNVFNFAQAAMMTIAFYAAYATVRLLELPAWLGFAAALFGGAGTAAFLEITGFKSLRARKASPMFVFIFTLVVSQFVMYLMAMIFGTWPTTIFTSIFWPVTLVGPLAVSAWDLPAILATGAAVAALWAFMRFSRPGQFMVAVADNPDLAELYGIPKDRIFLLAIVIAGLLVGLGMFLYGTRAQVQPAAALELMLFAIAATIIGGIGNIWGAALTAIALGLVQNASILVIPSAWQGFLLYAFLFCAIVLFPRGLRLPERRAKLARKSSAPGFAASPVGD